MLSLRHDKLIVRCLPPIFNYFMNTSKNNEQQSGWDVSHTNMAYAALIYSVHICTYRAYHEIVRMAYVQKGLLEETGDIMINSIAQSLKQYKSSLKRRWTFTHLNNLDLFNSRTTDIIKFLSIQFKDEASYTTFNTARSTASLISAYNINKDGLISRFIEIIFKQRPSKSKYSSMWDIDSVLEYVEKMHPIKKLKLKEAAEKVVTLLVLTTAQRLQTLAFIELITEKTNIEIKINITELIKTSKAETFSPN
ncbi:uncharacterized protein LOC124954207 [Vespa velutina]|uniref:uncharacterized protein LOC124954207 n=1 Tax=Vespa velutina TaxID=202808 RepID=UPI001FB1CA79|nr:uncharacterized protein LOC124954207 [Vespa velutina]